MIAVVALARRMAGILCAIARKESTPFGS